MASSERMDLTTPDWNEFLFHAQRYAIARHYGAGKIVLDCGCGEGYGSAYIADEAKSVTAFDLSTNAIDVCKARYGDTTNLTFAIGNVAKLPYPDESFEVVSCFELIEHIPAEDQIRAFNEIRRVLKKDGVLIMSSPNRDVGQARGYSNPYHLAEISLPKFREEMQARFKHVEIYEQDLNMVSMMWRNTENESKDIRKTIDIVHQTSFENNRLSENSGIHSCYYALAICSNKTMPVIRTHVQSFFGREPANIIWNALGEAQRQLVATEQTGGSNGAVFANLASQLTSELSIVRAHSTEIQHSLQGLQERLADERVQNARLSETVRMTEARIVEQNEIYNQIHMLKQQLEDRNQKISQQEINFSIKIAEFYVKIQEIDSARITAEAEARRMQEQYSILDGVTSRLVSRIKNEADEGQKHQIAALNSRLINSEAELSALRKRESRRWLKSAGREVSQVRSVIAPLFSTDWYLARNPDVRDAGIAPLRHYVEFGFAEGRRPHPLFDSHHYLSVYEDVRRSGMNPFFHFLKFGQFEGRNPNPYFETTWYLDQNPDVKVSKLSAFQHYIEHGYRERRDPGPRFSAAHYLANNPQFSAEPIDLLAHALDQGSFQA